MTGANGSVGERLFRLLLRLYPREFRERYAEDMLEFHRQRMRGVAPWRAWAAWFALVPDLVANGIGERFARLHLDPERAPRVLRIYSKRREDTMSILLQDIRHALRQMRRRPAFTGVVLVTLALGIGANAAIFTVVNAVLLRPLPFAHPERMVDVAHDDPYRSVSEREFVDYRRGVAGLERLAAYSTPSIVFAGGSGDPLRTSAARVSGDFFDIMGVTPQVGRVFAADEFSPSARAQVVILGHRLWTQQFGGDPAIAGRTVNINGTPYTVVGVMPAGFTFPDAEASVWVPWRLNPDSLSTRNNHYLRLVGLVSPSSSLSHVRAEVRTLDARWMHDFPETYAADKPIVARVTPISEHLLGPTRPYLLALLGAVGFILAIACANVANLLLVRGESRRKELAIRTALGASGGRIVRQLLTESMVLALFGAVLGAGVAWAGTRLLVNLAPPDLPRIESVGIDGRVVAFTMGLTVLTGLVFGLVPALRSRRGESADALREGGKASFGAASGASRRLLVAAEVALAVITLAGAGLLVRSLASLQSINLGFDPAGLMTMQVTLPRANYDSTSTVAAMDQLVARAASLPGVTAAGAVDALPISGSDNGWSILLDGHVVKSVAESPTARPMIVTPDYFRAMRTRLLRGRAFSTRDRTDAPLVAVISEGMAKQLWPGTDPIGHTLRMFASTGAWVTIVGVVADTRVRGFQQDIPMTMYFPYAQAAHSAYVTPRSMTLVVRTNGDPAALTPGLRQIVRSLDAAIALSRLSTMRDVVGSSIASRTFSTALLGGFAVLALLLAGVGIYGVVSYGVSQRTHEIGVRMAMGASRGTIVRMVLSEGTRMSAVGLASGLAGAAVVDRLIRTLLVGVSATDPITLGAVVALLALAAASACVLPARRAAAVSPTEALRNG